MDILIVDDEITCCDDLSNFLIKIDHNVDKAYDGKTALEMIDKNQYDVIMSDVSMPEIDGFKLASELKKKKSKSEIILISGKSKIINSIDAIDLGIYDFIIKPIDIKRVIEILDNIKNNKKISYKSLKFSFDRIIEESDNKLIKIDDFDFSDFNLFENKNVETICVFSKKMENIYKKLKKIQEYPDIPVLIEGKTGVGKELVAKFIHYEGPFQNEPFVALNCAAINKEMFEAELFGYVKGAFTGANPEGRTGFVQIAKKGTLFLDEITELAPGTQTKLLRLLQEKEFYKIGGDKKYLSSARFVCASNMNINSLIEKGLFREDLYFRLNLCKIVIPPLIERKEEVLPLAIFFIKNSSEKFNKKIKGINSEVLKILYKYDWPGNVRELKNITTKLVVFNDDGIIRMNDLDNIFNELNIQNVCIEEEIFSNKNILESMRLPEDGFNLEAHIDEIIKNVLKKFKGNKTKAAKYLGITRMQLYNRYKTDK